MRGVRVLDSILDLGSFLASEGHVRDIYSANVVARTKWIKAIQSNLTIDNITIAGFACDSEYGLLMGKSSVLTWNKGSLEGIWTSNQFLMHTESSTLAISQLTLTHFNATFVDVVKGSVEITDSFIMNGGQSLRDEKSPLKVYGAMLHCTECHNLTVSGTVAANLTAVEGGAVYVTFLQQANVLLDQSLFVNCSARKRGGVVFTEQGTLRATSTIFSSNSATDGGALYIACEPLQFHCESQISNSIFDSNTATSGGAVRWYENRPVFTNNTFTNNLAKYGPNEASDAAKLGLIDAKSLQPVQFLDYYGIPGQLVPVPLLIGLIDTVGQLVSTDSSSYVNIEPNEYASFYGPSRLIAVNGIANYSAFVIDAEPGSTLNILAKSDEISIRQTNFDRFRQLSFTYNLRDCIPGEHAEASSCYICPKSSYSLTPTQECTKCPSTASCPGGALVDLSTGYWRSSYTANRIEKCFLTAACEGGLYSTCGEGFTSNLCGLCAEGWYRVGKFSCFQCSSNALLFTRIVILGLLYLAFLAFALYYTLSRSSVDPCCQAGIFSSLLKILLAFIQSMMLISGLKTEWNTAVLRMFEVMEFFGTLVIGSFSPECYLTNVVEIPMVYFKLILVSIGLLILLVAIEAVWAVMNRWKTGSNRGYVLTVELIFLMLFQPMQVKYAMSMFDCKELDTGYWLTAHLSERCWEGPHRFYLLTLALPSLILFGGGSLALLSFLAFTQRAKYMVVRSYLSSGYTRKYRYWELVCQVCKLLLAVAVGALGATDPKLQILATTVIVFSYIYVQVIYRPYVHNAINRVAQASMVAVYAYVVVAFYNLYFGLSASVMKDILSSVSFLALLLFLLYYSYELLKTLIPRRAKVTPQDRCRGLSIDNLVPPHNSAIEQDPINA